jgi:hypothetical protein
MKHSVVHPGAVEDRQWWHTPARPFSELLVMLIADWMETDVRKCQNPDKGGSKGPQWPICQVGEGPSHLQCGLCHSRQKRQLLSRWQLAYGMDIYTRNRVQRPDWRPALCSPLLRRLRSLDHIGLLEPRSWETSLGDTVRLCLKKQNKRNKTIDSCLFMVTSKKQSLFWVFYFIFFLSLPPTFGSLYVITF